MFAVDHAATALLIKRRYPSVPMAPILVSVQAMELAWVGLNYLGIERTTTEATVDSVADIHLAYMPYSHSVGTAVGAALLAWLIIEKGFGRAALGRAVGLGIVSHLILDLATHGHDIVLWPGWATPKLGLGLYDGRAVGGVRRRVSLRNLLLARLSRRSRPVGARRASETSRTCRFCRRPFPVRSSTLPAARYSSSALSSCRSWSPWCSSACLRAAITAQRPRGRR